MIKGKVKIELTGDNILKMISEYDISGFTCQIRNGK